MQEPETLRLRRRKLDPADYEDPEADEYERRNVHARESDYTRLVTAPTIVVDAATEQIDLVYLAPIAEDCRALVKVLQRIETGKHERTGGC